MKYLILLILLSTSIAYSGELENKASLVETILKDLSDNELSNAYIDISPVGASINMFKSFSGQDVIGKSFKSDLSNLLRQEVGPQAIKSFTFEELQILTDLSRVSKTHKLLVAKLLSLSTTSSTNLMMSISEIMMERSSTLSESKKTKEREK